MDTYNSSITPSKKTIKSLLQNQFFFNCLPGEINANLRYAYLLDHFFGHQHFINELTELGANGLTILELYIHRDTLLLQQLYFAAYRTQILLKTVQHGFDRLQCLVAWLHLIVQFNNVLSFFVIFFFKLKCV